MMKTHTAVRSLLVSVALTGALAFAPSARAQDLAAAEALFREGRALLDKGQYDAACPKLAESQRLDPSSGTLLNLATCHEKQGKTATAWAEFLAAGRLAQTQGKADRAEEAKSRAAAIAPKLSYLTLVVTDAAPGLEIRRDDVKLEASTLGSKLPTDPGEHTLAVSAPGYQTLTTKVTVGAENDAQTVTIPALQKETAPATAAAPVATAASAPPKQEPTQPAAQNPPEPDKGNGNQTLGLIVGGVGVAALGVGAVFGVMALGTEKDAKGLCPTHKSCSGDAVDKADKANLQANIANVGVGLGIVGIGLGAYFLLSGGSSAPPEKEHAILVLPDVTSDRAGVFMRGGF